MCFSVIQLKNGASVPCGRCPKCVARRVSGWSFRLMQEEKVSTSAEFLTLTYATDHVPCIWNDERVLLNLYPDDLTLFFKRLRKAHPKGNRSIKYYAVGEYGGRTARPHYHILLFNAIRELIQPAWNMGEIFYGKVEGASIGYCLKYMSKDKKKQKHWLAHRTGEFSRMSKGLGVSYLENEIMCNWHIKDMVNRMYCTTEQNVKIAMPRYYKNLLYLENERSAIRDAMMIKTHEAGLKKLDRENLKDVRNYKEGVKAAYEKMYSSTLKTMV